MALTQARTELKITGKAEKAYGGGPAGNAIANLDFRHVISLAAGTGAFQADLCHFREYTITDGGTLAIDVAGSLQDPVGETTAFAELVSCIVVNAPVDADPADVTKWNTTNITVGGGTNPLTGLFAATNDTTGPIRPGGAVAWLGSHAGGFGAVTAGSSDTLTIVNGAGAAAKVVVLLIGRSA